MTRKATHWRFLWLALLVVACLVLLVVPLRQRAHETRVTRLMHQLQRALLAYHEREEIYVPHRELSGGELAEILRASEDLQEELANPFGEGPYGPSVQGDPIRYRAEGDDMTRYYLGVTLTGEDKPFLVFESPPKEEYDEEF